MVHRAGVGPQPCPVDDLTATILIGKLQELTNESIRNKTMELAKSMNEEDGVMGGLEHFCISLPRDSMMCDVSLIMGRSVLAKYHTYRDRINISQEVAAAIKSKKFEIPKSGDDLKSYFFSLTTRWIAPFDPNQNELFVAHGTTTFALGGANVNFNRGVAASFCECIRIAVKGACQWYLRPDKYARSHGFCGCICGALLIPIYTIVYLFNSLVVFIDRLGVAFANGCFGKQWLYFIDKSVQAKVYNCPFRKEKLSNMADRLGDERKADIKTALTIAQAANRLWEECNPEFPDEHWHWREVPVKTLQLVVAEKGRTRLGLRDEEYEILLSRFEKYSQQGKDQQMSFSRFCLFIGEAVNNRCIEESIRKSEEIAIMENIEMFSNDPTHVTVTVPMGGGDGIF